MPESSYVVSAKKATACSHAVVGNFTGENELNLILEKVNRFEILTVTVDGLKPIVEVPVFGRITVFKIFRPKGENRDSLIILTAKYHLSVVSWDKSRETVTTRAYGNVQDRVGRECEIGPVVTVHASGLIALCLYEGFLKIADWRQEKELKCYNVRVEDLTVIDVCFMNSEFENIYRLAYISQDKKGRHLTFVELNTAEQKLCTFAKQDSIESEAMLVIPIPRPSGGVIVLGQETVLYKAEDKSQFSVQMTSHIVHQATFTCYGKIDANGQRYLLGDDQGRLYMMFLELKDDILVTGITLEYLGETTIAESIVYLDNSVVFIASRLGDSQLIRLSDTPNSDNTYVNVLETFPSLAPIRDLCIVSMDGQTHLITASGAFKEGSLRVIRNGIGIEEAASVDLPGVKRLFSLRYKSDFDNYILVSLANETHILELKGEELEDTQLLDLETNEQTLFAGCIGSGDFVLQITPTKMRLAAGECTSATWRPADNATLNVVSVNKDSGQIVVSSGCDLYYLHCDGGQFELITSKKLDNEIACMDLGTTDSEKSTMVAVCLWNELTALLLSLPDLKEMNRERLPGETLPRSTLLCSMEACLYLLVATGDGSLYYYPVGSDGQFGDVKKASLGTQPPSLHRFRTKGAIHVFACSDRPAVIFSSNGKLVFSNVNLKLVNTICLLNSEVYHDSLVMSDGDTLFIGTIDDIQKMHIRTVPLGESVSRVAYQKSTATLGILVSRDDNSERVSISRNAKVQSASNGPAGIRGQSDANYTTHSFVILDQNTFEAMHSHELSPNEVGISLISAFLGDDPTEYYVVGTSFVYQEETEAKSGRILVFKANAEDKGKLTLESEKEVKGCAFSLAVLGGKLVACINSSTRLFEWNAEHELKLECSYFNNIQALYVKVMGENILVGDLMRSVTLLNYKSVEATLEEVAKDTRSLWTSAVEFFDAEHVLTAETCGNIIACELDRERREHDEARMRLHCEGLFYLGEMVNVFRRGGLVASLADNQLPFSHPILYGTSEGSIGLIVRLPDEYGSFFSQVEKLLANRQKNCMRVEHANYRQFCSNKIIEATRGFIDGDLVESILDLPRNEAIELLGKVQDVPRSKNEGAKEERALNALKLIEDLSRIH